MRTGHSDAARFGDKVRINIRFAQSHIGTILAIKDKGKLLLVSDSENGQCRQTLRIGFHPARIDAQSLQLFANEASHMFVTHACNDRRTNAELGRTSSHIGGTSSDIFLKGSHIFQSAADLTSVQIHGAAPNCNKIKCFLHRSPIVSSRCGRVDLTLAMKYKF